MLKSKLRIAGSLVIALAFAATSAQAGEVKIDGKTFTLPDGFTIERVAASPLVDRPIEADFDEQGNLYVTDSSGSPKLPSRRVFTSTNTNVSPSRATMSISPCFVL